MFAVTQTAFHLMVLTYWRRRLVASTRPHGVFEAVSEVVALSVALLGRKCRAANSMMVEDAVTQMIAKIRLMGWNFLHAGQVVADLSDHDHSKPGNPDIDWHDKAARANLVFLLVSEANTLLATIDGDALTETQ